MASATTPMLATLPGTGPAQYVFRLYISPATPASSRALVNVRALFDRLLPGRHELQIINVAEQAQMVRADQIIASPTLIRLSPLPVLRFIGDLSDTRRLVASLGPIDDNARPTLP